MTDLITFFDINKNLAIYTGENIHGFYCYMGMTGAPTHLNCSSHIYQPFRNSSCNNNDIVSLQTVMVAVHVKQKVISELYVYFCVSYQH